MTENKVPTAQEIAPQPTRWRRAATEILSGSWLVTVLSIFLGLVAGAVLIIFSDAKVQATFGYFFSRPGDFFAASWDKVSAAYGALFRGAIFDWQAGTFERMIRPLTESLVWATPLILAGLAIAVGFRAGLFNIGGQGQVLLGAMWAGFIGYVMHLPPVLHVLLAVIVGGLAGSLWAAIAGFLKARTGANEVITTIMLNNISGYLIAYMLHLAWFKQTNSPLNVSANVEASGTLPLLLPAPFRLHAGFLLAIMATVAVWWLLERMTLGFELRAVGANPHAARTAGISVERMTVIVMAISGALAGLAGAAHVLGTEHRLTTGIAGTLGFDAITVALLGRSRPLGVFLSGLLFGALRAGGYVMAATTNTPTDIVLVVQSVVVLLVAAPPLVRAIFFLPGRRKSERKKQRRITAAQEVAA